MGNKKVKLPKAFYAKLKGKYAEDLKEGVKEWREEESVVRRVVDIIGRKILDRYEIGDPLGVGGVGIVIKVKDANLGITKALKFPRPKEGSEGLFAEIMKDEISSLIEAVHPNIIEIYKQDTVTLHNKKYHFYIMEYIEGAENGYKYFCEKEKLQDKETLLRVIGNTIEGLYHLHKNEVVHLDVKLENILVAPDGHSVITDLGSARSLIQGSEEEEVRIICDYKYAHPYLMDFIEVSGDGESKRATGYIERGDLDPKFDLYALGKNLFRLLAKYEEMKWVFKDLYTKKYLSLLAARLLDGINEEDECAVGLPREAFSDEDIKYVNISEVRDDFKKLTGEYPIYNMLPELDKFGIKSIHTTSLGATTYTPRVQKIISHPTFRRLSGISQLGFINLIYPTATHSRLEHCLGTFSNAVRYCEALYNDRINPFFKQVMKVKDIKLIILTALCHDLGHFALAHDFEEADKDIFSHTKITKAILEGSLDFAEAESLLKIMSDGIGEDIETEDKWSIKPEWVVKVLEAKTDDPYKYSLKDRFLHTIIDGPIDADKLDYLVRDSISLNLPFGKAIDFERLVKCLTVIYRKMGDKLYIALGIHEKGRVSAETVAFVRYSMFGTVYWHHTSRSAKAMLHRAIWEALLTQSRKTELRSFETSFNDYVLESLRKQQVSLFSNDFPESGRPHIDVSSQLMSAEKNILDWLSARTSPKGKKLLEDLVDRSLYKRACIIGSDSKIWRELIEFRSKARYDKMLRYQEDIERRALKAINDFVDKEIDKERDEGVVLDPVIREAKKKLDSLEKNGICIFLVDIPLDRSMGRLEYLPESARREAIKEWRKPCSLEDSVIWNNLVESFLSSAGKIRVFCHRKTRDIVEFAVASGVLKFESLLADAFVKVSKEKMEEQEGEGDDFS